MKRTILTLLLALVLATPALATTKRCPPKCKHRATQVCARSSATASATNLYTTVLESLELSAGFRWQTERDCQTLALATHDPFYLGAQLSLPLAQRVSAFGAFERDWTDAPHWQARTGLAFTPFSR